MGIDSKYGALEQEVRSLIIKERTQIQLKSDMLQRLASLEASVNEKTKMYDVYLRAINIVGNVADDNTNTKISAITTVINRALAILFPNGERKISLQQEMYRNAYPHFNVILTTENGVERTFKQSGTGLGQIVSFLFVACLIDARGGRKLLIMDEVLNGLHPDAKGLIKELMTALSKRFQFICVEYGLNIGKQYEVVKRGDTSTIRPLEGAYYYGSE